MAKKSTMFPCHLSCRYQLLFSALPLGVNFRAFSQPLDRTSEMGLNQQWRPPSRVNRNGRLSRHPGASHFSSRKYLELWKVTEMILSAVRDFGMNTETRYYVCIELDSECWRLVVNCPLESVIKAGNRIKGGDPDKGIARHANFHFHSLDPNIQ
jgi:hypothetical protein